MADQMHKEGRKCRKHGRGLRSTSRQMYLRLGLRGLHAATRLARFMRKHPNWDAEAQNPSVEHTKLGAARGINRTLARMSVQS